MASKIETRITGVGCEVRAAGKDNDLSLEGYAARHNIKSNVLTTANGQQFREVLAPGCFKNAIDENQDVIATFNHDASAIPLGRTKSGTLKLSTDDKGLKFRVRLDPTNTEHRNLHASVLRRDVQDCSFAFSLTDGDDSWEQRGSQDDNGNSCPLRTIRNVSALRDISIVCSPAYPNTSVDARSLAHYSSSTVRPTPVFISRVTADAEMRKQIAAFDARQKSLRVERFKRARAICARYPELSFEHVLHCIRLNYSEDVMLQLRFAAITEKIHRAGVAFEAEPMRGDGGQAADPEQKLRDDDDFDPSDADNKDEHERGRDYHRALARKAKTLDAGVAHFKAADLHSLAAQTGDANDSSRARAASRLLRGSY